MEAPTPKLAAALVAAQMESRGVTKDKKNDFHRYNYASTETLIIEAQGSLHSHGLALHPANSEIVAVAASGGAVIPPDKGQSFPLDLCTVLILRRRWRLTHTSGEAIEWGQDWPIVPERGRPLDKATAAADTASLGYTLRDLLLLARVEKGTDLDDDSRDEPRRKKESPAEADERRETHHPSWASEQPAFFAKLKELGVNYEKELKPFCAALRRPKPSEMEPKARAALLTYLGTEAGKQKLLGFLANGEVPDTAASNK